MVVIWRVPCYIYRQTPMSCIIVLFWMQEGKAKAGNSFIFSEVNKMNNGAYNAM